MRVRTSQLGCSQTVIISRLVWCHLMPALVFRQMNRGGLSDRLRPRLANRHQPMHAPQLGDEIRNVHLLYSAPPRRKSTARLDHGEIGAAHLGCGKNWRMRGSPRLEKTFPPPLNRGVRPLLVAGVRAAPGSAVPAAGASYETISMDNPDDLEMAIRASRSRWLAQVRPACLPPPQFCEQRALLLEACPEKPEDLYRLQVGGGRRLVLLGADGIEDPLEHGHFVRADEFIAHKFPYHWILPAVRRRRSPLRSCR